MNELLTSIRADLTDRRLLPAVVLVGVCLLAALAYALLGGSGAAAPTTGVQAPVPPSGVAVTATTPERAVAETTDGFKEQNGGKAHDPFLLLPSTGVTPGTGAASHAGTTKILSGASSSSSSSSPSTSTSGSSGSLPSSGGTSVESGSSTEPSGEPTKPAKKKPKTVYDVAVQFGTLAPGATPESAELTPFTKLKLQTPLPSVQLPLLVFRGVTAKGRSATFTVVGEAILSGTGACLPSPAQCEAVDLKPGQTEQLSYLAADGQTTLYELRVIGITAEKAKAATARAAAWAESKAGLELLRKSGQQALPFLHYSTQPGVLVFAPRKAAAARAQAAVIASAR